MLSVTNESELEIDEGLDVAALDLYDDENDHNQEQCLHEQGHAHHLTLGPTLPAVGTEMEQVTKKHQPKDLGVTGQTLHEQLGLEG